jgi:hypothetical protein
MEFIKLFQHLENIINSVCKPPIKKIAVRYNKELEEVEKRVKAGKFMTNEQVMKEMKK